MSHYKANCVPNCKNNCLKYSFHQKYTYMICCDDPFLCMNLSSFTSRLTSEGVSMTSHDPANQSATREYFPVYIYALNHEWRKCQVEVFSLCLCATSTIVLYFWERFSGLCRLSSTCGMYKYLDTSQ